VRNKRYSVAASCALILASLACNLPGGGSKDQPDFVATITAQALQLQNATSAAGDTPAPEATLSQSTNPQPSEVPGPAAPAKPRNFKAGGSATGITFTWNDNSLDESGFRIYQEGAAAPIASIDSHPATGGMSYNWTGLACGFKARFSVRAYNDAGESDSSNAVDGVTIPCAPTNLVLNGQGNAISFNWAVAKVHNEDGFHIYQQGVSAPVASRGPNKGSGGTIYDLVGLPCNLVATYSVTAYNSAGESPASNLAQSETVPCGPSGLHLTNSTDIVLEYAWTDNATSETGFHVYRDDILFATLAANAGTGTVNSASVDTCGRSHVFSVKAFNYAGESTTSEHVGMSTQPCP
jgi:hypothetical protein